MTHTRHRQRGLGNIGGEDQPAPRTGLENARLAGCAEARVERENVGVFEVSAADALRDSADLALAGQEDQHVAARLGVQFADRRDDGLIDIDFILVIGRRRAVTDLDRVGTIGNDIAHSIVEEALENAGINGGRGQDQFQIGSRRQHLFEIADQEIDIQRALVHLVDD